MGASIVSLLIAVGGAVIAYLAISDNNWIFSNARAMRFIAIIGRTATRVMYTLIGAGLFVVGTMALLGFWKLDLPE